MILHDTKKGESQGVENMKVNWELDTDHPQDLAILNAMHKLVKFDLPAVAKAPTESGTAAPAAGATPEAPPTAPKKAPAKKRQPKEKTKDQLLAMSLEDMIEYLKARTKHSVLDCRILAKHYNDKFGEVDSVLNVLHKLDASTFDDLKKVPEFLVATIKMIEAKETSEEEESTATDGFLGV